MTSPWRAIGVLLTIMMTLPLAGAAAALPAQASGAGSWAALEAR